MKKFFAILSILICGLTISAGSVFLFTGCDTTQEETSNTPSDENLSGGTAGAPNEGGSTGEEDDPDQEISGRSLDFNFRITIALVTGPNTIIFSDQSHNDANEADRNCYFDMYWRQNDNSNQAMSGSKAAYGRAGVHQTEVGDRGGWLNCTWMSYNQSTLSTYYRFIEIVPKSTDTELYQFCGVYANGMTSDQAFVSNSYSSYKTTNQTDVGYNTQFIYSSSTSGNAMQVTNNRETAKSGCSYRILADIYLVFRKRYMVTYNVNASDAILNTSLNKTSISGTVVYKVSSGGDTGYPRSYTKTYSGEAIIGWCYRTSDGWCGPLMISKTANAVAYTSSHDGSIFSYEGSFVDSGVTWYYSSGGHWFEGNFLDLTGGYRYKSTAYNRLACAKDMLANYQKKTMRSYAVAVGSSVCSAPTRPGYTFTGWYNTSASSGGTQYTNLNQLSGTTFLYARWTEATYAVTLNTNGGSGGPSTIYLKYNNGWYSNSTATTAITSIAPLASFTLPTRSGYVFDGYYTSTAYTNQIISAGGTILSGKKTFTTSATTLYAKWIPKEVDVTLNPNGGSFSSGASWKVQNLNPIDFSTTPSNEYGFVLNSDGYYENENKGIHNSYALAKVTFKTTSANQVVTFNCKNYGESTYDYGILSLLDGTLSHSNTVDSSSVIAKSFSGSQLSTVQTYQYTVSTAGTHYIYIKYRKDGSANSNNDSFQFGCNLTITVASVADPTTEFLLRTDGYYESQNQGVQSSFSICKVNIKTLAANQTITFSCISYAESNYDFGILSELDTILAPNNTEDTSNVKKSFKSSNSSSVQSVSYTIATAGEHYIYIKYKKDGSGNSFNDSLRFKVSNSSQIKGTMTSSTSATVNVRYNETYNGFLTPTRTGYDFAGWYTATSGGTRVYTTSASTFTGAGTFYAQWTIKTYTITVNFESWHTSSPALSVTQQTGVTVSSINAPASGGSVSTFTISCQYTTVAKTITFNAGNFGLEASVYSAYNNCLGSVSGWTLKPDKLQITWTPIGDCTIKLTTRQKYTISYNANGGSGTTPANTLQYHGTASTLATNNFTKNGYSSDGWNTMANGTGSKYASGSSINLNRSLTLYANWTAISVRIDFSVLNSEFDLTTMTNSAYAGGTKGNSVTVSYTKPDLAGTKANVSVSSGTYIDVLYKSTVYFSATPNTANNYSFMGVYSNTTGTIPAVANYVVSPKTSVSISQNNTYYIYACFKQTSANKIKYDSREQYFYFEDGSFPQTYVETISSGLNSSLEAQFINNSYSSLKEINYIDANPTTYSNGIQSNTIYYVKFGSTDLVTYARFFAPKTTTLMLYSESAGTYKSYSFTKGQGYWFRVDPIRWRISDYGVSKSEIDSDWLLTGYMQKNVNVVSNKVLWFGSLSSTTDLEKGSSSLQLDSVKQILSEDFTETLINSSVDTSKLRYSSALADKTFDISFYGDETSQNKTTQKQSNDIANSGKTVLKDETDKYGTGYTLQDGCLNLASKQEIAENFSSNKMKASQLVAFLLGINEIEYADYWTRDLGQNLGTGIMINAQGREFNSAWADQKYGMCFSMNFKVAASNPVV